MGGNFRGNRSFLLRIGAVLEIILLGVTAVRAGGPAHVAGTNYFDPAVTGQPVTWAQGQVVYFTDQGDLSPILPNSSANTFVTNAFSVWTSVPTAALAVSNGGQLAEDVNGTNLSISPTGAITGPSDITAIATTTPLGIVYDYDGSVTDDLLGAGAGGASECFTNAAFGGADNFGIEANVAHALIVINGQCAQQTSQLADVEYRLVRVFGSILGVGWSQLNLNVITGNPHATPQDYAGFPVMHYKDLPSCVPITLCYVSPYTLAMDDVAEISCLYPVTAQNQSSFPGSQIFSAVTARIHGSVWFTDSSGNAAQAMQGVNVVARWIDPTTGQPSRQYAASSVSGFLFSGNQGNPITGTANGTGVPFSRWGSNDASLEGFFDLAGLQIPNGASSAQYQLRVEAVDSNWSLGVGPYAPLQVAPSGTLAPIVVTVSAGTDLAQDILMSGSAQAVEPWAASETWSAPAVVPVGGDWMGSLNPYGDAAYFSLAAQANRTLSVAVTALDEAGNASENKAQPVIGMWSSSDLPSTRPGAATPSAFNSIAPGLTRLDAQILTGTNFLIGLSDIRGDGRPDYHYHAHVLYGDSVTPTRVSAAGGTVTVNGIGFSPRLTATVGGSNAQPMAASAGEMMLSLPAMTDGPQTIVLTDPTTGSFTTLTNAVTSGAASTDKILLVAGSNPATPVGTQAAHPFIVRVVASDGVTPVPGATVGWIANNGARLSICGGISSCAAITDQGGESLTWVTPELASTVTVTATLAPGAYSSPPSVTAQFVATTAASEIGLAMPYVWMAQGANFSLPLNALVLNGGAAQNGATVNFRITSGTGSLSAASALTNANGNASVMLTLTNFSGTLQGSACLAPSNAPCQNFYVNSVALSALNLQPVAGSGQIVTAGQALQPVTVRVVDSSSPPNAVAGAGVAFLITVARPVNSGNGTNPVTPVILGVSQGAVTSDVNGLASVAPSSGGFSAPLEVNVGVSAGNVSLQDALKILPAFNSGLNGGNPPTHFTPRLPVAPAPPVVMTKPPRCPDVDPQLLLEECLLARHE